MTTALPLPGQHGAQQSSGFVWLVTAHAPLPAPNSHCFEPLQFRRPLGPAQPSRGGCRCFAVGLNSLFCPPSPLYPPQPVGCTTGNTLLLPGRHLEPRPGLPNTVTASQFHCSHVPPGAEIYNAPTAPALPSSAHPTPTTPHAPEFKPSVCFEEESDAGTLVGKTTVPSLTRGGGTQHNLGFVMPLLSGPAGVFFCISSSEKLPPNQ